MQQNNILGPPLHMFNTRKNNLKNTENIIRVGLDYLHNG